MADYLQIHPENPQARLIGHAAGFISYGGVFVYPTDSGYSLGCLIGDKEAVERIRRIRRLDKTHLFTVLCRDLSEISKYAQISNPIYRLLKANTPGAYTFVLRASRELPKLLQHSKRKTIGLRIPMNPIVLALLEKLDAPLLNVSLVLPEEDTPPSDFEQVERSLSGQVDLIIDGGFCGADSTTIVDLTEGYPQILRAGKGDTEPFSY